jgi:hypothetical protein
MLKELQAWAKLKCFSRKLRKLARNIIDVRWVIKFKYELPTSSANGGPVSNVRAVAVRTIRARLTVRGFKNVQKNDVARYAGISSRSAQNIICYEAARRGWPICSADISKAFLQGMSYTDMARIIGEPEREVNLCLPTNNIPLLRQIPGF